MANFNETPMVYESCFKDIFNTSYFNNSVKTYQHSLYSCVLIRPLNSFLPLSLQSKLLRDLAFFSLF